MNDGFPSNMPLAAGAILARIAGGTTFDINGGTIDGTVIGGTTPAAGSFTTLTMSRTADAGTTEAVRGDDTRLSDARTPTSHAVESHTVSDNTTLNVSATAHGLFPKLPSVSDNKYYGIKNGAPAEIPAGSAPTLMVVATSDAGQSSINSSTDLEFEDEAIDTNAAWSGTVFTAPAAGRYLITVCVQISGTADVDTIRLLVNGSVVEHSSQSTSDLYEMRGTFVVSLAASDTVKFRLDRLPGSTATRTTSSAYNKITISQI